MGLLSMTFAACSVADSTPHEGYPTSADAHVPVLDAASSGSMDAGMRDASSINPSPSAPDASTVPCQVDCPEGTQCHIDRCVVSCPCPAAQQCYLPSEQCVPSRCERDRECPVSMFCVLNRCVPIESACNEHNDCSGDQRCTQTRQCTTDDCLSHHDCGGNEFCVSGNCQARALADPPILFERVRLSVLETHRSPLPNFNMERSMGLHGEWGYGATLLDIDGDLDLDLFLGSQAWDADHSTHACLFRNDSLPGQPRFRPVEVHCGWREKPIHSAFATDIDNDGIHELLLGGMRHLALQIFAPEPRQIDLFDQLTPEQRGNGCMVGSLVSLDVNYDGFLDLIVGCQSELDTDDPIEYRKLLFIQTPAHDFRYASDADWSGDSLLLGTLGNALALGAVDLNDDGLQDLLVSHDVLVRESHIDADPGGIYLRCDPSQACDFEPRPLGQGDRRFGAFMGSGVLQLADQGRAVYFTDWGANRLVNLSSTTYRSSAVEWNADLSIHGESHLYGWGVVVDDFDRDGKDDLFVGQGSIKGGRPYDYRMHYDALLLQREQQFDVHSDEVGIPPFTLEDSGDEDYVYSTRAVLKTDWDYDGFIELISTSLEGAPRILREVPLNPPQTPRCTLIPRSRYAHGFGTGYRIKAEGYERAWDSQGQLRSSGSPYLVTPYGTGHVRFPSGALVPYDCEGRAGPFIIVEPAWLQIVQSGDRLTIETDDFAPRGELSVWLEPSHERLPAQQIGDDRHQIVLPQATRRVMLRFGQRWLPRWFDVEPTP